MIQLHTFIVGSATVNRCRSKACCTHTYKGATVFVAHKVLIGIAHVEWPVLPVRRHTIKRLGPVDIIVDATAWQVRTSQVSAQPQAGELTAMAMAMPIEDAGAEADAVAREHSASAGSGPERGRKRRAGRRLPGRCRLSSAAQQQRTRRQMRASESGWYASCIVGSPRNRAGQRLSPT